MKIVNVQDAKSHFSRLLERVAKGKDILPGKHGKPMARLTAYAPDNEPRRLGGFEGRIRIADDFDAEDPTVLALFYGKNHLLSSQTTESCNATH